MSQKSNSTLTQLSDDSSTTGRVVIKLPAASTQSGDDTSPGDVPPAATNTAVASNTTNTSPPTPIPAAPSPLLNPSSERRMTRQSERTALTLTRSASVEGTDPLMDESLRSFFQDNTSAAPPTKDDPTSTATKGKGKGKAGGADKERTAASGSGLARSPSKTESAAATVRRVESRVGSLADIVHANTDELAQLRSHIQSIAADMSMASNHQSSAGSRTTDLADDPMFQELAHANNRSVSAIDTISSNMERMGRTLTSLERRIAALEPHIEGIYSAIDRLEHLTERIENRTPDHHVPRSNSPMYGHRSTHGKSSRRSDEEMEDRHREMGRGKRRRTTSGTRFPDGYDEEWYNISGTIAQPPFRGSLGSMARGPSYQQSTPDDTSSSMAHIPHSMSVRAAKDSSSPVPHMPPAMPVRAPTAAAASAPAVPHAPDTSKGRVSVVVGKVTWGKNTTGGFKAIMDMMPALNRISRAGIRAIRIPGRTEYVRVNFGSDVDAVSFSQLWTAGPRPTDYENVTAVLEN